MTWTQFAELYLKHSKNTKSFRTHRNFDCPAVESFGDHIGRRTLKKITPLDCELWKQKLFDQGRSANGVAIMMRVLGAALNYAVSLGLIDRSPMIGVTKPQEQEVGRALTSPEVSAILSAAPEPLLTWATISLNTGLRVGEIEVYQPAWVRNGNINIPASVRKTRRDGVVPLNSVALDALRRLESAGKGGRGHRQTVQRQLLKLSIRLKLGHIRFHDLRHTFVTTYLKRGHPKDLLGVTHNSLAALNIYAHPDLEHVRSRMEGLYRESAPQHPTPAQAYMPWWSSVTTNGSIKPTCAGRELNPQTLSGVRTSSVMTCQAHLLADGIIEED